MGLDDPRWRVWFRYVTLLTAILGYVAIVLGGYVTSSGSGFGCGTQWPTCNGGWTPVLGTAQEAIEYFHRIGAGVVGVLMWVVMILAWLTQRRDRKVLLFTSLAFFTLGTQVLVGVWIVTLAASLDILVALHLGLATAFFAFIVVTAVLAFRPPPSAIVTANPAAVEPEASERKLPEVVKDYAMLLKPGILSLLVVTAVTAMVVAGGTAITPLVFTATVVGGALSAGSASAMNHYLEREVDLQMTRTRSRPLPAHRVPAGHALAFAVVLGGVAFLEMWAFVNFLAAALALGGLTFYVLIYTTWLKPSTPQNIVVGGAAGAFPALVGWAAVTNSITIPATLIGLLVFLWTPPHFWSLAVIYRDDYRRAGFPMLPVLSVPETKRQMLLYTAALVAASFLFVPLGVLGFLYLAVAVGLGVLFLLLVAAACRSERAAAMGRVFRFSICYLLLLFGAMIADRLLL